MLPDVVIASSLPEPLSAQDVFPDTAQALKNGRLAIGGCDLVDLAERHGTPLYVYDLATIHARIDAYRGAIAQTYPGKTTVCYAAKAYCAPWLLKLIAKEGLGLDVVSGGELHAAVAVDFPRERIYFHGNNKSVDELRAALEQKIGRVVLDNLEEVERLASLARERGRRQAVLLRVGPGVDPHTHAHLTTGALDTKFGLDIASGAAEAAVRAVVAQPSLDLRGFHAHIGSQIRETEPYAAEIDRVFAFAKDMRDRLGVKVREISPGGGYGVRYTPGDIRARPVDLIRKVSELLADASARHGFTDPFPEITIEPGRSIIATSAVALYRVGSIKEIPGVRTYVAVDGGMADNIRPTAYGATYTAVLANRIRDTADAEVAIAGKYCETGDVLIQNVRLPRPRVEDIVAIPASGAYHLSMASNYNLAPRPAVVVVDDGRARLVRRRETYDDLLAAEILD